MDNEQTKIINDIQNILMSLKNEHDIKEAYLYGSYADGTQKNYSNIDIAIILGKIEDTDKYDESFEIFHKLQNHNSLYESLCFEQEQFFNGKDSIIRNIKKSGIKVL